MNEEIKEKLDLNPNNMNEIAKQAYYQLENYIFTLEETQNNWNELKKCIEQWIDYHSVCDKDYKALNVLEDVKSKMQELEGNNDR